MRPTYPCTIFPLSKSSSLEFLARGSEDAFLYINRVVCLTLRDDETRKELILVRAPLFLRRSNSKSLQGEGGTPTTTTG